ncbi:MAG: PLP-dependent aminotransferase family protein [Candidatus Promineifilaceae bacterium]
MWQDLYAQRAQNSSRSAIREILKVTQQPDVISFAGGLPAAELFPIERIKQATDVILSEQGARALQYSVSEGLPELRDWVANRYSTPAMRVRPENVLITSGSQQALDMLGKLFLDEGDCIAVENPTYLGALQAWGRFGLRHCCISADHNGMIVDELAEKVQTERPKLLYIPPNFQNPSGTTLSLPRRQQLIALARQHRFPIIEDDAYGELRYSGEALPSLMAVDATDQGEIDGHVIHVGTVSKILTPGLRVGWVIAPESVIEKLVEFKQSADLHTNTLAQLIAVHLLTDGQLEPHIETLRRVYRERRDKMLAALKAYFPASCRWTTPDGGMFLMVTLPETVDSLDLLQRALEHNVAFVPGSAFYLNGEGRNTLRLNFSNARPDQIEKGIRRLGALLG